MTRHGKNCTAGSVYTYHEKQRDSKTSGWGSLQTRLGKDAVKEFDCCSLTLQPCKEPVVTVDGHLYDKESILECILHQKQVIVKKMKTYNKQLEKEKKREQDEEESGEVKKVDSFLKMEKEISTKRENPFSAVDQAEAGSSKVRRTDEERAKKEETIVNTGDEDKKKNLPSFWIPSLTPQATADIAKKPDIRTYCPMSGKSIKLKNLIKVKFTRAPDEEKDKALIAKTIRYICPVTNDILGNNVKCAVLRPSGDVVTWKCVEKFICDEWRCPLTGATLTAADIIPLKQGGTGYAAAGAQQAKAYGPSMVAG